MFLREKNRTKLQLLCW